MPDIAIRNEVRELRLLFEISQTLDGARELSDHLQEALALMAQHTGMTRGTVALAEPDEAEIAARELSSPLPAEVLQPSLNCGGASPRWGVEAAYGFSSGELDRAIYKLGQTVTGQVIQSGTAMAVPRINLSGPANRLPAEALKTAAGGGASPIRGPEEPHFLNRTNARDLRKEDIAFICVPVFLNDQAAGGQSSSFPAETFKSPGGALPLRGAVGGLSSSFPAETFKSPPNFGGALPLRGAVGALSADKLFADSICLEEDLRLLQILASLIARAVRKRRDIQAVSAAALEENKNLRRLIHGRFEGGSLVGRSAATEKLRLEIKKAGGSGAAVLIQGESGVGKKLIADLIHSNSPRAERPLVRINCAARPEIFAVRGLSSSLPAETFKSPPDCDGALPLRDIESELFGCGAGVKKGRFDMARGGTLFLDEVWALPLTAQAKLLRALEAKEPERADGVKATMGLPNQFPAEAHKPPLNYGGALPFRGDVRLIAATSRNLENMVAEGTFRQDLFYRLNAFPLHAPPLRDRRDDIMPLAEHFAAGYSRESGRRAPAVSPAASALLLKYDWPGNIGELRNIIERAVILCGSGDLIDASHLPFSPDEKSPEDFRAPAPAVLSVALADVEKRLITEALKAEQGNMAKAAERLGITVRIMGLRMKAYGLNYRDFRQKGEGDSGPDHKETP